MSGAQPAAVTVKVTRTRTSTRLEFRAARRAVAPLRMTLAEPGVLEEARRDLDDKLTDLKDALPGVRVDDSSLEDVFQHLRQVGLRQIFLMFDLKAGVLHGLQEFWNRALPFGRNPAVPPLVECIGDKEAVLPLEYLPLFRIEAAERIRDRVDFIRACRALVGFSCVVRRTILPASIRGAIGLRTNAGGRMPLRYLQFEHLDGAKKELQWLSSVASHRVEIEGPYPTSSDDAPSLSEQIFDPRLLLAGGRRELPDQIQHFACHCYARAQKPLDNEIELSGGGREVRLALGKIGADLVSLTVAHDQRRYELPLVMMNACGSSRLHASSALSFPWLFLRNGNRGFVGSDIEMPDDVAAEFSKALYERFLVRQQRLGAAFHGARNHLLNAFGNPLGIAYSAYADPDLHVRPSPDEETNV